MPSQGGSGSAGRRNGGPREKRVGVSACRRPAEETGRRVGVTAGRRIGSPSSCLIVLDSSPPADRGRRAGVRLGLKDIKGGGPLLRHSGAGAERLRRPADPPTRFFPDLPTRFSRGPFLLRRLPSATAAQQIDRGTQLKQRIV
jgi:hypothetical protein